VRKPHARAKSIFAEIDRLCGSVKAHVTDNSDREKWEKAGIQIEDGYDDFFGASNFVMVITTKAESMLNTCSSYTYLGG
jgi:hypothetical protein